MQNAGDMDLVRTITLGYYYYLTRAGSKFGWFRFALLCFALRFWPLLLEVGAVYPFGVRRGESGKDERRVPPWALHITHYTTPDPSQPRTLRLDFGLGRGLHFVREPQSLSLFFVFFRYLVACLRSMSYAPSLSLSPFSFQNGGEERESRISMVGFPSLLCSAVVVLNVVVGHAGSAVYKSSLGTRSVASLPTASP